MVTHAVEQGRTRVDIEVIVPPIDAQPDTRRGACCRGIVNRRLCGLGKSNSVKLSSADSSARRADPREKGATRHAFEQRALFVVGLMRPVEVLGHSSRSPVNLPMLYWLRSSRCVTKGRIFASAGLTYTTSDGIRRGASTVKNMAGDSRITGKACTGFRSKGANS